MVICNLSIINNGQSAAKASKFIYIYKYEECSETIALG